MAERKCVKLKVNMYEDTKFKIIDMKPERDLIHYIWTRLITLAGKVNDEGKLYMSRNIPYTIETLAIEFNRGAYQVKLALDVFMELEMVELTEDNVYIVKNFAKHQNIKPKETAKTKDKEEYIRTKKALIKGNLKNDIYNSKDEKAKNKVSENKIELIEGDEHDNLEIENRDESQTANKNSNNTDNNTCNEKNKENLQENIPKGLKTKNKKRKNKKIEIINFNEMNEKSEDNSIIEFYKGDEGSHLKQGIEEDKIIEFLDSDEERLLEEGESLVMAWSF